jgi:radical SAM superfamily enzyme YgiQ (UPF0313 family)
MRITLIMGAAQREPMHGNNPFMPLSLPLLAATAPGHNYTIIDLLAGESVDFSRSADLVGISVRNTSEERSFALADAFRSRGVPVVLGGPQVSANAFEALAHADAVVVGEGDRLWPVVVEDVTRNRLKRLYVCAPVPFDARGYSCHQIREYDDLQHVKAPLRGLVRRRYVFDTVFASRGCPIGCDFCYVPAMFGSRFRLRPVEDVVAEISTFRRYFYLIDDTVFGKPSTYGYYSRLYDSIGRLTKKRYWTGQANLDAAADPEGREVIIKAQRCGLLYAAIGIESINPAVLERSGALRKTGVSTSGDFLEKLKQQIRFIQDLGIIVSGWFVIGYDEDTEDTWYRTFDFCSEMNMLPAIFPAQALPGTKLFADASRQGRLKKTRFSNMTHPTITDEAIERAYRCIMREGYSCSASWKRLGFYWPRFRDDRIHKSIFLAVLQKKFSRGVDITVR